MRFHERSVRNRGEDLLVFLWRGGVGEWSHLPLSPTSHGPPRWLRGKESTCNAGVPGSIPGSGRSPEEGSDTPLQHSSLGNPMDRGAWQATVYGVAKSQTRLSDKNTTTTTTHLPHEVSGFICTVSLKQSDRSLIFRKTVAPDAVQSLEPTHHWCALPWIHY